MQGPPVGELSRLHKMQYDFPAPSDKAETDKQKKQHPYGIAADKGKLSRSRFFPPFPQGAKPLGIYHPLHAKFEMCHGQTSLFLLVVCNFHLVVV